jgi:hypothetical protein
VNKASRAFIAVLVFCAVAVYAVPASAATTIAAPPADPMVVSPNCPWGYASATEDGVVAHGEKVVVPSTDTVLDSFSFYVTQLREDDQFVGEPRTITYKAYVGKWDGPTFTEPVWQSDLLTVTTSPDPDEWETTVQTGGVRLEPGQQYALFFSTLETNEFNTLEDRGCSVNALGNAYDPDPYDPAAGASLIRYLSDTEWRVGVAGSDVAFKASFSAYDFDGFYAPVENRDASGNFILNAAQGGQVIPLKFRLGGDYGLDVLAEGYPKSEPIACNSQAEVNGIESTAFNGGSGLSYHAGSDTYTYGWTTNRTWVDHCRQLVLKFDDGTTARANFKFKK